MRGMSRRLATPLAIAAAVLVAGAALTVSLADDEAATTAPTVSAPAVATTPEFPIGDARRLPLPEPGSLAGVLLTADGACAPSIVDLAAPAAPGRLAIGTPACAVVTTPSGSQLVGATGVDPEGLPVVVLDTASGQTRTARRVHGSAGAGPPVVTDGGSVALCDVDGVHVDDGRRDRTTRGVCARVADGPRVLVLARDRRTLRDARTGRAVIRLARRVSGELPALIASRHGGLIAAFAYDVERAFTYVTVFDRTGAVALPRRRLTNGIRVRQAELGDDGVALTLRTEGGWEVHNLRTGDRLRQVGSTAIVAASVAPDGASVAVATTTAIVIVEAATLSPLFAIPASVRAVAWLERSPGRP